MNLELSDEEASRDVRAVREYAEPAVRLAIDPIGEVEGIGIAVIAADPEINGPKPNPPYRRSETKTVPCREPSRYPSWGHLARVAGKTPP
jgi:hypothetical protein